MFLQHNSFSQLESTLAVTKHKVSITQQPFSVRTNTCKIQEKRLLGVGTIFYSIWIEFSIQFEYKSVPTPNERTLLTTIPRSFDLNSPSDRTSDDI